jgi:hypothetical protein
MKLYLVETEAGKGELVISLLTAANFLAYVKNSVADGYYDGEKPKNVDDAVNTYNANEANPVKVVNTAGSIVSTGCVITGAFAEISVNGDYTVY